MPRGILPPKETAIPAWLTNFVTVATANSTMVALPSAMLTSDTTLNTQLQTQQNAVLATRQAAEAAVKTKNVTVRQIETTITAANKLVQSNANVTPGVKQALGLTAAYARPMPVIPIQPVDLVGDGNSNGTAALKWNRNGNKPGTVFEIYAQRGTSSDFVIIGTSTSTKFTDEDAKPGEMVTYRVRARRSIRYTVFSNDFTLYPVSPRLVLQMSKAA